MKSSNYFNWGKKFLLFAFAVLIIINFFKQISTSNKQHQLAFKYTDTSCWVGAGIYEIPDNIHGDSIRYGRDLIAHTAKYFGCLEIDPVQLKALKKESMIVWREV
jgi:cytochrome c